MASKSINILIKIKESGKNVIPSLSKSFDKLNLTSRAYHETLRSVNGTVKTFTDSLKAMAAAFVFGKGLKDSITLFANFESALADMSKVTSESLGSIKEKILALPPALGSSTQLLRGYYQVISAGVKEPKKALDLLVVSAKAAKSAHVDQAEVIKGLTKVMAGYEGEIKNATEAADLLFTIEKEGQTTVAELIPYIGSLAKLSHDLGISQDEMAAAFAQVTQTAGDTSEAAVQYQGVLQALMKPSEAMKKALQEMGFESAQAAIRSLGLAGTLKKLKESTGGSAEKMAALFGNIRGLKGMLALSVNDFASLIDKIEQMEKKTGALDKAWEKYKGTLKGIWTTFTNTVKKMAIYFGEQIAPAIKNALKSLNDWFDKNKEKVVETVKSIGKAVGDVIKNVKSFGAKLLPLLKPLSSLLPVLLKIAPALITVGAGFKALKLALGLLLGVPLSLYKELKALYAGFKVLTAGSTILTYVKHVQMASTYTNVFKVAVASLGNALTVLGASLASAFAGWQIGKLISEWDVFGLLPMKVKYYVQLAYSYIDEFITKAKLAFSKFKKYLPWSTPSLENKKYQKELEDHLKQIELTKKAIIEEGKAESQAKRVTDDKTRALRGATAAEKDHEAATRSQTEAEKEQQAATEKLTESLSAIGTAYDELRQRANDYFEFAVQKAQALADNEAAGKDATLDIYRQKTDLMIKLAEQEAQAKLRFLKQSNMDEARAARVRIQIAQALKDAKIRALKEWRNKLKQAINDSYAQEKRIADKIKGLQESLVQSRQSASDRIRELNRSLMSERQAWEDKRKQALETLSKAEEKMWSDSAEGLQEAVQLAKKAQDQYAGLAGEVKEGQKVVVSQAQSVKEATDGIKLAERILEVSTKRQIEMQKKNLQAVRDKAKEQKKDFDDITKKLNELDTKVVHPKVDFKPDTSEVDRAIKRLERTTHSTHIIHVKTVKESRWGGLMSLGGKLPGWGGGDRIRALLEAGEFVIRKEAVRKYGAAFFDALNSMKLDISKFISPAISQIPSPVMPRYAEGGMVKPTERLELNLRIGDVEAPITISDADSRAAVKEMFKELSKMRLVYV